MEALKKKDKHEQSAVASSEVKQKLQGFLLSKKQREATGLSSSNSSLSSIGSPTVHIPNGTTIPSNGSPPFRTWSVVQAARLTAPTGNPSDLEGQHSGSGHGPPFPSHPYRRHPFIPKFEDDFPLRKTGRWAQLYFFFHAVCVIGINILGWMSPYCLKHPNSEKEGRRGLNEHKKELNFL